MVLNLDLVLRLDCHRTRHRLRLDLEVFLRAGLPHFNRLFLLLDHFHLFFLVATAWSVPLRIWISPLVDLVVVYSWSIDRMHRRHLNRLLLWLRLDLLLLHHYFLRLLLLLRLNLEQ